MQLKELGQMIYLAAPILMTGLSVSFAFRGGLFNIGVAGQYTMGMYFAMAAAFFLNLPAGVHWLVCCLAGLTGGLLWGLLPGTLKAWRGVNEVISAIMFNYIGMYLVDMWVQNSTVMYEASRARTRYLPGTALLPSLGIAASNANIAIFIAVVGAVLLYVVLNKTVLGYELNAVGLNREAAIAAGMNGKGITVLSMAVAGALAGLGGAFAILAPAVIPGSSVTYEPINVIAAAGFQGIAAALLGQTNPLGTIIAALFLAALRRGGRVATLYGYRLELVDIVVAAILFFAAFVHIRKRRNS